MKKGTVYKIIIVLILLAGAVFLVQKYRVFYNKLPSANKELASATCPSGWNKYTHEVLGIRFCYPPEWGAPVTEPAENLTKLAGAVDQYTGDNVYFGSVFIKFPKQKASHVTLRFFNDRYPGERYPNAYAPGFTDNIGTLKASGNICDYKIDYTQSWKYSGTLKEIWNECKNNIKTALMEKGEYFDFQNIGALYSYTLNGWAYKKLNNGYFDNLLVEEVFDNLTQIKESLRSPEDYFSGHKTHYYYPERAAESQAKAVSVITPAQFAAAREELDKFVKSIEIFKPVPAQLGSFSGVSGENSDITAIRKYYWLISSGKLEEAYAMKADPDMTLAQFREQYADTHSAQPRDFKAKGNQTYDFNVDYQEENQNPAVYQVTMQIAGGKIKTLYNARINTAIVSSGPYAAYSKTIGNKTYMILSKNGKEKILDEARADFETDGKNFEAVATYAELRFSPSGKYFSYRMYGWEWSMVYLYELENSKRIIQSAGADIELTPDEKYAYMCIAPGMNEGEGKIIALPKGEVLYDVYGNSAWSEYMYINCEYDASQNSIMIELGTEADNPQRTIRYDLNFLKAVEAN